MYGIYYVDADSEFPKLTHPRNNPKIIDTHIKGAVGNLLDGVQIVDIVLGVDHCCITPTIKDIALYRVNVTQLAQNLQTQGLNNSRDVSHLVHPALPTYWYWGVSGVCDVHEANGDDSKDEVIRCRRKFLPTQGLLTLVEESLRDSLNDGSNDSGDNTDQIVQDVVSAWNTTVSKRRVATFLAEKEEGLPARLIASAALAIAAVVLDFGIAFVAGPCASIGKYKRVFSTLLVFSGLQSLAAGTLAILSMRYGVRGMVSSGENGGPAIIILFVAVALKGLTAGMAFGLHRRDNNLLPTTQPPRPRPPPDSYNYGYHPSQPPSWHPQPTWNNNNNNNNNQTPVTQPPVTRPPLNDGFQTSEERRKEIGFKGEDHIDKFFKRSIPGWSAEMYWTSKLRSLGGEHREFTGYERDYADFTYDDSQGHMGELLAAHGAQIMPGWSDGTKYHIEVKTTTRSHDPVFFVSENQVAKMLQFQDSANDAFILACVYQVNGQRTDVKWFSDPLSNNELEFSEYPNQDGYYEVRTRSSRLSHL
ncbi:hypothetical protein QBC44DRAFT_357587 [Cladorrhinum sp. PSN332]|nr:hypothetical protein QBC44DRAFT_357587 [Cladorrhinum sp. PSN332]